MTAHNLRNFIIFQDVISDSPLSPSSIIMTHYVRESTSDSPMDITAKVGRSLSITHFVCACIKHKILKYFICSKFSCQGLDQFSQF